MDIANEQNLEKFSNSKVALLTILTRKYIQFNPKQAYSIDFQIRHLGLHSKNNVDGMAVMWRFF